MLGTFLSWPHLAGGVSLTFALLTTEFIAHSQQKTDTVVNGNLARLELPSPVYVLSLPPSHLMFSPAGDLVVSTGNESLCLLDWTAKRVLRTYDEYHRGTGCVAFGPDGSKLAISGGKVIRIRETATGMELQSFHGHAGGGAAVAFSEDGKSLATAANLDPTIRIWDIASGSCVRELCGHTKGPCLLAYGQGGKTLVSASQDETARVWSMVSGEECRRITVGRMAAWSAAVSPDGRWLAVNAGPVQVWDLATGKMACALGPRPPPPRPEAVTFSPNARLVAGCRSRGELTCEIAVWELATGSLVRRFEQDAIFSRNLVFAPDGKTLVARGVSGEFLIGRIDQPLHLGRLELIDPQQRDFERLWSDLASPDGARAYQAIWSFVAFARQSAPFLIDKVSNLGAGDRLAGSRAIDALEYMNTPEALDALKGIAKRAMEALCREEANAALERQTERGKRSP